MRVHFIMLLLRCALLALMRVVVISSYYLRRTWNIMIYYPEKILRIHVRSWWTMTTNNRFSDTTDVEKSILMANFRHRYRFVVRDIGETQKYVVTWLLDPLRDHILLEPINTWVNVSRKTQEQKCTRYIVIIIRWP